MFSMRFAPVVIPLLALAAAQVRAGECRDSLRSLLLQNPPHRDAVQDARQLCAAAAEAGDADALYQSALFSLGLLEWDVDAAIPLIREAAGLGVAEAQYWLAWQYEEGPLLPNDAALALQWYERAGDNDHRLALDRLATAHRDGELGLEPSARRAAEMWARAERCKDTT